MYVVKLLKLKWKCEITSTMIFSKIGKKLNIHRAEKQMKPDRQNIYNIEASCINIGLLYLSRIRKVPQWKLMSGLCAEITVQISFFTINYKVILSGQGHQILTCLWFQIHIAKIHSGLAVSIHTPTSHTGECSTTHILSNTRDYHFNNKTCLSWSGRVH